ncbi:hypothetical protein NM208_g5402 [Fusarium decemcellulare]|uniref:Uncharacterized protein n=1 Tax=Fusarium decemcellulare TaxID=57161 RepID=A0ACC1SH90_9HYPO|nr:hypothetical protein NM208_g5402 [Fusarium decemcellulare]
MKRFYDQDQKGKTSATLQRKRPRHPQTNKPLLSEADRFQDGVSSRQQAEGYRLVTANISVDALSCAWRKGMNRHVNRQHVSKLCNVFKQGGLERQAEENYLLVQCSSAAVERMISHLEGLGHDSQLNHILSFDDWNAVNPGEKVEVMAGQHRIEALREYARQAQEEEKDLWWTCVFYDRDRLPQELDIKLRVNRRDLNLPDSHGQIWMQLVLAAGQCGSIFEGKKAVVEKKMADILRLGCGDKFPTGRLFTLWRNDRWRPMITRWCETQLGRATFNISTWDWMASCRIDSYWFSTFEQALESLGGLPGECIDNLHASDWAKLAAALPKGYTSTDVQKLFYPEQTEELQLPSQERHQSGETRHKGFLLELGDESFSQVYRHISDHPTPFPDVKRLLKITKEEGRILTQVMIHVVAWVNSNPAIIIDRRQNNKPLIREDLKPALQKRKASAQRDETPDGMTANEDDAAQLEQESIQLEQAVLDAVCNQMDLFKTPAIRPSLDIMPDDDKDGYKERFRNEPWNTVLAKVEDVIGPLFSSALTPANPGLIYKDTHREKPTSSITRAICELVNHIPEIAENPALHSHQAYQELGAYIDRAVLEWAVQRCRQQLKICNDDPDKAEPDELRQTVDRARVRYEALLRSTEGLPDPPPDEACASTSEQPKETHTPQRPQVKIADATPKLSFFLGHQYPSMPCLYI